MPRQVEQSVSPDSFRRSVKTAYSKFVTEISHDSVEASLENPGNRLEVERKPAGITWELTTAEGTLEVHKSGTTTLEKTKTSKGTLVIRSENGRKTTSFEGYDRDSVERTYHDLRSLLEKRIDDLENRRERMKRSGIPDVEVVANASTASGYGDNDMEHVILVNSGLETVNLKGWKLENNNPDRHEFGEVELEPMERLKVYTGEAESGVSDTGLTWENTHDTVTLYNSQGVKVDGESY